MEHHQQVFPSNEAMVFDKSNTRNSPHFPTYYDQHLLESDLLKSNFGDMCDCYYGFQTEAGKSADPRMLTLLEFFRELYYRRRETFKNMIPSGLHDEFVELFDKIGGLLTQVKSRRNEVRTIKRSLSLGSKRTRGGSGLKMERFKVRAVTVDGGGNVGSGAGGQTGQGDKSRTISLK